MSDRGPRLSCVTASIELPLPTVRPGEAPEEAGHPARETPWRCVVWDDPINLMSYVTYVFMDYFGYPREKAHALMLAVHESGSAVVSTGVRERIEADVQAMHRYGLWATMSQEGEG